MLPEQNTVKPPVTHLSFEQLPEAQSSSAEHAAPLGKGCAHFDVESQ
jgi:hypothetical protein